MDIQVNWNGNKSTIPHPSIPAFQLLCEQYGIRANWDKKKKKLHLERDDLQGKKVILFTKDAFIKHETKVLEQVRHFLSETGIEVTLYSNSVPSFKKADVIIQCGIKTLKKIKQPESTLFTPAKLYPKILVEYLQKDLKSMGMISKIHRTNKNISSPFIQLEFNLPLMENDTRDEFIEHLSISVASGILRYFQQKQPMTLLASLSPELRQTLLNIIPNFQQDFPRNAPLENLETNQKVKEKTIVTSQKTAQEAAPGKKTSYKPKAEVFFDYTLVLSKEEEDTGKEDQWLILGNLMIKNTGTTVLSNPTITLQLNPSCSLNIGGQTLPPAVVESLATQTEEGPSGWKFLDDDYLKKGKENGIYRIVPIQPLRIQPGEIEMHGLQISIIKSNLDSAITVDGFVKFEEQGYQVAANNKINISF